MGVIILIVVGLQGVKHYNQQKEEFDTAAADVANFESGPLYPKIDNKNAKNKALIDYVEAVESVQEAFEPFRPEEIVNLTPQEFSANLLAANTETRKAFEDAGVLVPDPYFVGFEIYKTKLADGKTTGVLNYQLGFVKNLMLTLAKSKPTELKNLYRPTLPEDEGDEFTPPEDMIARPMPLELTFTGSERSVRDFLSAVNKLDKKFVVIRSLRITNEKKDAPKSADAQFEKPAEAKPADAGDPFGGFVLPGEEPAAPAPDAAGAAAPEAAADVAPGGRILVPVLGSEHVNVFLRLDLLKFLPAKKLP